jgi:hypothetical protein
LFREDPSRSEPDGPVVSYEEWRPGTRSTLGVGTLACSRCDAPVLLDGAVTPSDPIGCPFCRHEALVREFLSLAPPTRPTRVVVRVLTKLATEA